MDSFMWKVLRMYGEFGSGWKVCMESLGLDCFWVCGGYGLFGFYEGVKDFVGKDGVVIIQLVADCVLSVNVEPFNCI